MYLRSAFSKRSCLVIQEAEILNSLTEAFQWAEGGPVQHSPKGGVRASLTVGLGPAINSSFCI